MTEVSRHSAVLVRDLAAGDLEGVLRIDQSLTGEGKPSYWRGVFGRFLDESREPFHVGLAAVEDDRLVGYLLGEVRAFEFGSEPCGWVFAMGVEPSTVRKGVGSALLGAACSRFREAGVDRVRTMVRRNSVDVLSFFRAHGFVGGTFVQLELELEETQPAGGDDG